MVCAGAGEEVGDESAGLGHPLLVARPGLETIFRGFCRGRAAVLFVDGGGFGGR